MLTIFTVPKPFQGHVGIIQRNAIGSWRRLEPRCQVLLCGDEPGTADAAANLGAEQIPHVERNEYGTPLVSSVFESAARRARHALLCYVNADILLLADFLEAARRLAERKRRFLMVGQRWDLDVVEPLAFEPEDWEVALRARVARAGALHPPAGSDYFVFPRGALGALPPFAVGRPTWDNWLIYRARALRIPVVDATRATLVIHQNHGYAHVKESGGAGWEGPEADRNRALVGAGERIFTLADATHRLGENGVRRALGAAYLKRRLRTLGVLHASLRPLCAAARRVRGAAGR